MLEDVLPFVLSKAGDDLLQHVVTLFVLGQENYIVVLEQSLLNEGELFVLGHSVNNVLQGVGTPIVTRDFDELVPFDLLQKVDALVHLQILYELRAEVVSIVVRHQIRQLAVYLIYYFVDQRLLCHS